MKRFQKVLFALVVLLPLLVEVGRAAVTQAAAPAGATGVAFQSTSLPRQIRGEGETETVGEIVLGVTNVAGGFIPDGSSIDIVLSVDSTNEASLTTALNMFCTGGCPASVSLSTPADNTVRISFSDADLLGGTGTAFAVGDQIVIAKVRVNGDDAGIGPVTGTMSGVSATPLTHPISFTDPIRTIGVIVEPSLPVQDNTDVDILTCDPPESSDATADENFEIEAEEAFPAALTTVAQETVFSNTPAPTTGTVIDVIITGVPAGFIVTPVNNTGSTGTLVFGPLPSAITQTTSGATMTFTFTVTGTDSGAAEKVFFGFNIGTEDADPIPAGGLVGEVLAKVRLGPVTTSGIIRFVDNDQGTETVANIGDCQTYLLFSWNAFLTDGTYNTGLAINNSAEAPAVISGSDGETGAVTLYFYRTDGGPDPAPVVIATALQPGQTTTYVLSQLGSAFTGYIIAVCNFRFGHGINFLSNFQPGGYAQGFQALVITPPRDGPVFESLGH